MEELAYISLKPSRIARYLHLTVTLLALFALVSSGLLWWLKIILAGLLVVSGWQWWRDRCMPVQAIACADGQWRVWTSCGETHVELTLAPLVLSWLVVLQWRAPHNGKRYGLALWPDSAHQDDLRKLRVFLRFGQSS